MIDLEAFLAQVRRQARAATVLARTLPLPPGDRAVNVHSYGVRAYEAFVRRHYADAGTRIVALSMNPGPFGAVQTGIPFCDTAMARDLVPGFDALVRRKPAWLHATRNEPSGRQLVAFARAHLGGWEGLYRAAVFPMTVPIAVLRGPARLNVPLPALPRAGQRLVDAFLERHAADLVGPLAPTAFVLLGDYAEHVREVLVSVDRSFGDVPAVRVPHPAARIANAAKHGAWRKAFGTLAGAPRRSRGRS